MRFWTPLRVETVTPVTYVRGFTCTIIRCSAAENPSALPELALENLP
jgi:hypothetical protein